MRQMSEGTSFLAVALALAAAAFVTMRLTAANATRSGAVSPSEGAGAAQFFELRIDTAAPGKLEALQQRFRDHSLPLFEKHGIKSVGYWVAEDEKSRGRLYYIVAYPDRESRQRLLVNGVEKDPEFLKAVAESEKDGKLTEESESVYLTPTDYSPVR